MACIPGHSSARWSRIEAQRKASAYIHYLRAPEAEERLSANNFEKLLGMLSRFGPQPWLTPAKRAGYLEAWCQPGALTGMLNWYRATPMVVPKEGEAVDPAKVPEARPGAAQGAHAASRRSGAWTTGRCCP